MHIDSIASMISSLEVCTSMVETYLTALLSILPTRAVNDGRSVEPGAGWMTSAPDQNGVNKIVAFASRCKIMPTHNDGRICRIREERDITRFRYRIDPTEFHVHPV